MEETGRYVIGIDVGGTNTDAVIVEQPSLRIVEYVKTRTTKNISTGITNAIREVLEKQESVKAKDISGIMLGTTTFVNAVIQNSEQLAPVNVIRLCGPSTYNFPPFSGIPPSLHSRLKGDIYMVEGGLEYNGTPITPIDKEELVKVGKEIAGRSRERGSELTNIVINGVFSPVSGEQEEEAAGIIKETLKGEGVNHRVTLGSKIAYIGILEREGAAILNASLRPLAERTILDFNLRLEALELTNTRGKVFLTQNDGTLISSKMAMKYPVWTFNSGPTNSLRGAALLSKMKNALVADIGGTSTDVSVLQNGFPRAATSYVEVAGVRTNFRMPDTKSIGLGGGSLVKIGEGGKVTIGPQSVGYKLRSEGKVFGGNILTTTDMAIALNQATIPGGDPKLVDLPHSDLMSTQREIISMLEKLLDQMKSSKDDVPLILVGGGSILLPEDVKVEGVSEVIRPKYFDVANAVGAAIAQVSGSVDKVLRLTGRERKKEVEKVREEAKQLAMESGAIPHTIEVVTEEVDCSYTVEAIRVIAKAIGDLDISALKGEEMGEEIGEGEPNTSHKLLLEDEDEPFVEVLREPVSSYELKFEDPIIEVREGRKEWILRSTDVRCIEVGCGILGTGGGGSPYLGAMLLHRLLEEGKKLRVICVDDLEKEELVMLTAWYGAPVALVEKVARGNELLDVCTMVKELHKDKKERIRAVMPCEIGGLNCLSPMYTAAQMDMPLVDCDLMGRAFPKVQMITPVFYGMDVLPFVMCDEKDNRFILTKCYKNDISVAEDLLRKHVMSIGCSMGFSTRPFSGEELQRVGVKHSVSRAWRLGRAVLKAIAHKEDPFKAIAQVEGGKVIFTGKIIDMHRVIKGGYNMGLIEIYGINQYKGMCVYNIIY